MSGLCNSDGPGLLKISLLLPLDSPASPLQGLVAEPSPVLKTVTSMLAVKVHTIRPNVKKCTLLLFLPLL